MLVKVLGEPDGSVPYRPELIGAIDRTHVFATENLARFQRDGGAVGVKDISNVPFHHRLVLSDVLLFSFLRLLRVGRCARKRGESEQRESWAHVGNRYRNALTSKVGFTTLTCEH